MMIFPPHVQKIISTYQILGFLPLDKTLHFIVGAMVTVVGLKLRLSFRNTMIVLLVLVILKELIDLRTLSYTSTEVAMDIIVTFIYPAILIGVRKLRTLKD